MPETQWPPPMLRCRYKTNELTEMWPFKKRRTKDISSSTSVRIVGGPKNAMLHTGIRLDHETLSQLNPQDVIEVHDPVIYEYLNLSNLDRWYMPPFLTVETLLTIPWLAAPTPKVSRWGELSLEAVARWGIQSFLGMVDNCHQDCTSHFWCAPFEQRLMLMAEFYYNKQSDQHGQDADYIGCYLWAVEEVLDGRPVLESEPKMKMLIQPYTHSPDRRVLITYGFISSSKAGVISMFDQGLLDMNAAKRLDVVPKILGKIPYDQHSFVPTFFFERDNGTWNVFRVFHNEKGDYDGWQHFASLPSL